LIEGVGKLSFEDQLLLFKSVVNQTQKYEKTKLPNWGEFMRVKLIFFAKNKYFSDC
jgi:hypothetical protein